MMLRVIKSVSKIFLFFLEQLLLLLITIQDKFSRINNFGIFEIVRSRNFEVK